MDLNEMLIFARVVRAGGITAAATELGMPKSTVSRKLSELEGRLGARLLQRTTRKLSLTDVGRIYYEFCARIASEIEDAERAVSSQQDQPRGLLRITTGTNVSFLVPVIDDFLKKYPEVRVELFCTGRIVDLVEERFDLSIRAGTLADSSHVARSLGLVQWVLVATPAYVRRRGRPKSPTDLALHDCLIFGASAGGATVRLEKEGEIASVAVSPRLLVNDLDFVHAAACHGLGIGVLPAYRCLEELRAGRLERVLHEWSPPSTPIHVVYASTRHVSPKVKSFIEHLRRKMTPAPWAIDAVP